MITLLPLLALADPLNENPIPEAQPTKLFGLALRDLLLIAGVAIILGLALFLWAYLTHKGRRRHSGQHLSKPIFRAKKKSAR